jgi:hypothetical protein
LRTKASRPIHQEELSIGKKDQLSQVSFTHVTHRRLSLESMYYVHFLLSFSDGASAHFKNHASILNLIHHKADFDLDACWTFTATGHGKGAGDGIGAVLKSTTRRATLSKNMLLSTAKDFYEFSQKQQLETAKRSSKDNPGVHVFYLEADEVEQAKNSYMKVRSEKIRTSG